MGGGKTHHSLTWYWFWLLTVAVLVFTQVPGALSDTISPLSDSLHSFDRLQHTDIRHKLVKRSSSLNDVREIQFDTLGRHFHARLKINHDVMTEDFTIYVADKHNKRRRVTDFGDLYHGYLVDSPQSKVHAHYEGNALSAKIETKEDVYYVEPAWRFLNESDQDEMITYRASDYKKSDPEKQTSKFCGFVSVPDNSTLRVRREAQEPMAMEFKAPTPITKNTCPLKLVADYRFYESMGQKSVSRTTTYLLGLIDRINAIYRNTNFSERYQHFGFEVKEIVVHEEYADEKEPEHFNHKRKWGTQHLLKVFSRNSTFQHFCLAHLFTHQAFDGGVLGLAYIGSPRYYSVGGICSPIYYEGGYAMYLNTGWSSTLNTYKRRILTQEADLVTAHEFGHNWGSEHDPDNADCSPGGRNGGKYIMYTYSVPGHDKNNKLFSPCSINAMKAVLQSKSDLCFSEHRGAYCGNQKIEGEEECDGGVLMRQGHDLCCHRNCLLRKPKAQCSDTNHVCCHGCRYLGSDVVCREGNQMDAGCEARTNCSSLSGDCPESNFARDKTKCLNRGECHSGQCKPYCETRDKHSCICDNAADSCLWCCRDTPYSNCTPIADLSTGLYINLNNGTPCVYGFCNENGVCQKQEEQLVQRFWDIIENLNPSWMVAFMRANIVGTVIVLSLLLWVPGSCIVWCIDRRQKKEDVEEIEWLSVSSSTLTRPQTREQPKYPSLGRTKRQLRTARLCQNIQMNQAKGFQ